ncbi:MAG TPA: hypothetical protein VGS07_02315 [Thermoanaerobaculia bacterium]|nr:hypothetical protein [Thermoanaerobaculia bacterium]
MKTKTSLVVFIVVLLVALSGQAALATCTSTQKAAVLANLPPCGDEPPNCASLGEARGSTGLGVLIVYECLQDLIADNAAATCTLIGPPILLDGGYCRY